MAAMTGKAIREALEPIRVGDFVRVVANVAPNHPHQFPIGTVLPVQEIHEDGSGVDLGEWACRLDEVERVPASDAIGSGVKARDEAETFVRNYLLERDDACGFLHHDDSDAGEERKESAREIVAALSPHTSAGAGPVGEDYNPVPVIQEIISRHMRAMWEVEDHEEFPEPDGYLRLAKEIVAACPVPLGLEDAVHQTVLSLSPVDAEAGAPDHECIPDPMGPERCVSCGKRFRPRAAPSTPSPQKAGAGPVKPRRIAEGCCSAISPCGHQQRDPYSLCDICTRAGAGPVGEAVEWRDMTSAPKDATEIILRIPSQGWPDHYAQIAHWAEDLSGEEQPPFRGWFRKTGYGCEELADPTGWRPLFGDARPVEPGEVERLTRENNRLTDAAVDAEAALAESEQNAQGLASDLAGTQAELAETRERLEKVEAVAAENGRAGVEAAARYVEALWNAHIKEFGIYDPETNATEFRGASEDVDCLYQELIEGIRSLDTARVDRVRAALTGDAQEAGK